MARILRIFDISPFIHAGRINKKSFIEGPIVNTGSGYRQRILQTGGISLLFNILYAEYGNCDMVFCADRNPTIKKGMYMGYKCDRDHKDKDLYTQKEIAEVILKDIGFTVLSEEGYEADDFIYSAVKKFKSQYDKIYVHSGDSDMYFLVDENVEIAKTSSQSKEVNMENYPYSFKKGTYVPYNMGSFLKVLNGDTSDCIPPMEQPAARKLLDMFDTEFYHKLMGNKEFMRASIEFAAPWALQQFDLVYPLDTNIPDDLGQGSKQKILEWGSLMKNKYFSYRTTVSKEVHDVVSRMVEDGLYVD